MMKRLDDRTLEAMAGVICGAGEGAGGGYTAPGPYRTKTQLAVRRIEGQSRRAW